MSKKRKYWYHITYLECPICGNGTTIKELQYTPKPEDYNDRYTFEYDKNCATQHLL